MAPRQSRTRHTRHLRNTQTHHPGRKRHAVATQNHNQLHTHPPTRNIRKHEETKEQRAAGQEAGIEMTTSWYRSRLLYKVLPKPNISHSNTHHEDTDTRSAAKLCGGTHKLGWWPEWARLFLCFGMHYLYYLPLISVQTLMDCWKLCESSLTNHCPFLSSTGVVASQMTTSRAAWRPCL